MHTNTYPPSRRTTQHDVAYCMAPNMPCSPPPTATPEERSRPHSLKPIHSAVRAPAAPNNMLLPVSAKLLPRTPGPDDAPSHVSSPQQQLTGKQLKLFSCLANTRHSPATPVLGCIEPPCQSRPRSTPATPISKQRQDCKPHCQVRRAVHHQRLVATHKIGWRASLTANTPQPPSLHTQARLSLDSVM